MAQLLLIFADTCTRQRALPRCRPLRHLEGAKMANTILIVDDDRGVRDVLRLSAEERGYEVLEADDGPTGLAQYQSMQPDLTIIDVGLPGEYDGVELLCRMHEAQPRHPVLIISGQATPEKAVEAMKQGAFDYFAKPVDLDKLFLLAERAISMARKDIELERVSETRKAAYGFDRLIGS